MYVSLEWKPRNAIIYENGRSKQLRHTRTVFKTIADDFLGKRNAPYSDLNS
jgi:hypothetical protein